MKIAENLLAWLDEGREWMGEIRIRKTTDSFHLTHYLDGDVNILTPHTEPEDAIEIGKYDAAGKYRPLRTAPTLQRGWVLTLSKIEQVVQALDFFYPAMLGTYLALRNGSARPVDLRETVNRQTGMYRCTGKITNEQADELISEICAPERCLKTILWRIEPEVPIRGLPMQKLDIALDPLQRDTAVIPLPCEECCNILVAAARETVKKQPSPTPTLP